MKVVGIDPAPKKGLSIFDGVDSHVPIEESGTLIQSLLDEQDVLLCWDSPLTGPPALVASGIQMPVGSNFSQRPIESFFSRLSTGYKTPKGISVLGYAGCPHWALTRFLVGLPRTGPFDQVQLPYSLCTGDRETVSGHSIVEVHPAVAIWLWCRDSRGKDACWEYKRDRHTLEELWQIVLEETPVKDVIDRNSVSAPVSDDEFDSRIAYALGRLWVRGENSVVLLGDEDSGSFLLPNVPDLKSRFRDFL